MKIAFQMDPIGDVDINADSSFRLAEEAQARGHTLFFYGPDHLAYQEGRITARGHDFTVKRVQGDHVKLGPMIEVDLTDFDVVWLRQDPPFDMHYITSTHLLDRLAPDTLVVNDPFWVRNYPEKLMVLDFPDLDATNDGVARSGNDQSIQRQTWRCDCEAAVWQRRRGCFPFEQRGSQPEQSI